MDQNNKPGISICIPAYKRPENIFNLLKSIQQQRFTDFEVIISDDSPDDSVQSVINSFPGLNISYFRNVPSLGTPANWNSGISKARGEWIKIMHDDDWFNGPDSLLEFYNLTKQGKKFIFSGYHNVFPDQRRVKKSMPSGWAEKIKQNPLLLLSDNVIGPPSVTLIHHSVKNQYDQRMKWRVDIDYYVTLIRDLKEFAYTKSPLINVGISETQVTVDCINHPEVELPEGYLMLQKYGVAALKNVRVYDAWWRIFRNVGVRDLQKLQQFARGKQWPPVIQKMVEHQGRVPAGVLKLGPFSKLFMSISYLLNLRNTNN